MLTDTFFKDSESIIASIKTANKDKDIDGDSRIVADVIDIGADEVLNPQLPENNGDTGSSSSGGGGGGGCAISPSSSPANALLYLALPLVLFARRFLRG